MTAGKWGALMLFGALLLWKQKTVESILINSTDAASNANVKAFLAMIRQFESAGDYSVIYGGGHFSDFSDHPDIKVPFVNPARPPHADGTPNDFSTAAGAYQINWPTWQMLYPLINGTDFSPASQDEAAIQLLKINGALTDVIAGNFQDAIDSASGTWASLPASTSGQPKQSMATAQTVYTSNGGQLA